MRKIYEIVDLFNRLNPVMQMRLPVRVSFAVSQIMDQFSNIVDQVEEQKQRFIESFAEKDADGNIKVDENGNATISEQFQAEFQQNMVELLETEVDIQIPVMITMEDLEKCDRDGYDKLTPENVKYLSILIPKELEEGGGES